MAFSDFNFGGMKARVWFRLQNHPKYADKLGLAVNKGIQNLYIFARSSAKTYEASTAVDSVTGLWKMEYPLVDMIPTNVYAVNTVSIDGYPCRKMTEDELVATRIEQSLISSDPTQYYIEDGDASKVLILYPRPNRVNVIQIKAIVGPDALVDDTESLPFLEVESEAVEMYATEYLLRGQPGEEAKHAQIREIAHQDRAEAKTNLRLDKVFKTRRVR